MQTPKLSRPQVVKRLWVHIKGNELQNPLDKKEILCDDMMRAIFNVERINMFQMNKALGKYVYFPLCYLKRK
jgi:upstream activation factor subunit UAF30